MFIFCVFAWPLLNIIIWQYSLYVYPEKSYSHVKEIVQLKLIEAEWRIYASVNYTINGSDNGLSPGRRHAIIWTNAGLLLIGP